MAFTDGSEKFCDMILYNGFICQQIDQVLALRQSGSNPVSMHYVCMFVFVYCVCVVIYNVYVCMHACMYVCFIRNNIYKFKNEAGIK